MNEFQILNNIGKGSFSKVKKVLRKWTDSEMGDTSSQNGDIEKYFAMKVSSSHNLVLKYSCLTTFVFDK